TSSRARASPTQASEASAKRGSPIRMSNRTEESTAIIGSFHRIARGPSADRAHGLVGALEALGQLEPAAHLAQRLADVLAQDDAAAVQFHLEGGALGQAQRVAHGLGQGDLAAFGDGGFHGRPPRTKKVCIDYTYFRARTAIRISRHRVALAQRRGHGGGRTLATFIQPRSTDMADSFATRARLEVNGKSYAYASLPKLGERFDISKLPYSMKILLENLLRHEDGGVTVGPEHIEAVARWNPKAEPDTEIAFMPAR